MKAQPNFISPVNRRDLRNSKSYFNADDIKRLGLRPFQSLSALSGMSGLKKKNGSYRSKTHTRYAYDANRTPLIDEDVDTGLSIDKQNPVTSKVGAAVAGIGAFAATSAAKAGALVQSTKDKTVDAADYLKQRPAALLAIVPLFIGGIVMFSFLNTLEPFDGYGSRNSASQGSSASVTDDNTDNGSGSSSKDSSSPSKNSGTTKSESTTATASVDGNTAASTSAGGTNYTPGRGSIDTNVPAGGTTSYLPGGIPGVTEPVTVTVPGTNTTADGKTVISTDPISITGN